MSALEAILGFFYRIMDGIRNLRLTLFGQLPKLHGRTSSTEISARQSKGGSVNQAVQPQVSEQPVPQQTFQGLLEGTGLEGTTITTVTFPVPDPINGNPTEQWRGKCFKATDDKIKEGLNESENVLAVFDFDQTLSAMHVYGYVIRSLMIKYLQEGKQGLTEKLKAYRNAIDQTDALHQAYVDRMVQARAELQNYVNENSKILGDDLNKFCLAYDLDIPGYEEVSDYVARVQALIQQVPSPSGNSGAVIVSTEPITTIVPTEPITTSPSSAYAEDPAFRTIFPQETQESIASILEQLKDNENLRFAVASHGTTPKLILACLRVIAEANGINWSVIKDRIVCNEESVCQYQRSENKSKHIASIVGGFGGGWAPNRIIYADDSESTIKGTRKDLEKALSDLTVRQDSPSFQALDSSASPTRRHAQASGESYIFNINEEGEIEQVPNAFCSYLQQQYKNREVIFKPKGASLSVKDGKLAYANDYGGAGLDDIAHDLKAWVADAQRQGKVEITGDGDKLLTDLMSSADVAPRRP